MLLLKIWGFFRWFSSWENSCCPCNYDLGNISGGSSRPNSNGRPSNMLASMVGCFAPHWCTGCICSGKKFQFLNNILNLFSQIIFICCLSIFPFNFSILNIFFYQKQNIYIYISKVEEMDERPLPQSTKPDQSKTILLHCTRRTSDKSMCKIFQKPKPNFLKRYPPLLNYKSKANQVE